jgi:replicative DNA helicase
MGDDAPERLPPNALELEQALLGAILANPETVALARALLATEDFYRDAHKRIFRVMCELDDAKRAPDLLQVSNRLKATNQLPAVGGREYLTDLAIDYASVTQIEDYAREIRDTSAQRKLRRLVEIDAREILDDAGDARGAISAISEKLDALRRLAVPEQSLTDVGDIADHVFFDIGERQKNGKPAGIPTGYGSLDRLVMLRPGTLDVLAARPAMGKTSFASSVLLNAARAGYKGALFSIEMSKGEIVERMLSTLTGIDSQRLARGEVSGEEFKMLALALDDLKQLPIKIFDASDGITTPHQIKAKVRLMKMQGFTPALIEIDHLQKMYYSETPSPSENRVQVIAMISGDLKRLAVDENLAVILLSQLSREVEKRQDKRPVQSDLRDSGALEQDADVIMFVYREDYYVKQEMEHDLVELKIAKQRGGPTGTVYLRFAKAQNIFTEAGESYEPQYNKPGLTVIDSKPRYSKGGNKAAASRMEY